MWVSAFWQRVNSFLGRRVTVLIWPDVDDRAGFSFRRLWATVSWSCEVKC